jgi:hypothetical protein
MGRINQGQTQSGQVEHDETEGGTSGNPHSNSASFDALTSINATGTEGSTVSTDSPAAVAIEGAVQLFLQDKTPRGEALLEFMMESQPIAEAITSDESMMYVIHNEGLWDGRNSDPVPDDFDAAYTALPIEVAACCAYVERFLSDYTAGQNELDTLLDIAPVANDLTESVPAMHVIQEGDEQTDLQDYRV